MSQANPGAPSSHEISLAFELKKRKYKKVVRPVRCPDIYISTYAFTHK